MRTKLDATAASDVARRSWDALVHCWMAATYRARPTAPPPAPAAAAHNAAGLEGWRCELWLSTPIERVPLASGVILRDWADTAASAEALVLRRWVEVHGTPDGGRLACRAEPVSVG